MTTTTFQGMRVVVTPDQPKMVLSPGDYITPEYRQEIDQWLLGFFGTVNNLEDGQVMASEVMGMVWMNPRTYEKFKRASIMDRFQP